MNSLDDACLLGNTKLVLSLLRNEHGLIMQERLFFYACKGFHLDLINWILQFHNPHLIFNFMIDEITLIDLINENPFIGLCFLRHHKNKNILKNIKYNKLSIEDQKDLFLICAKEGYIHIAKHLAYPNTIEMPTNKFMKWFAWHSKYNVHQPILFPKSKKELKWLLKNSQPNISAIIQNAIYQEKYLDFLFNRFTNLFLLELIKQNNLQLFSNYIKKTNHESIAYAIFAIIETNQLQFLKYCIALNVVNFENSKKWKPIYHAIDCENIEALSLLHSVWDHTICHGVGLFLNAATFGKLKSIQWLYDKYGAGMHLDGLLIAIQENYMDIFKYLIDKNPLLITVRNKNGWSAPYVAVEHEQLDMLNLMLSMRKNFQTDMCLTLMEYACRNGKLKSAKYLFIEKYSFCKNCIKLAISHGQQQIIEWILEAIDPFNCDILKDAIIGFQNMRAQSIIHSIIQNNGTFFEDNAINDEAIFGFELIELLIKINNKELLDFMHLSNMLHCAKDMFYVAIVHNRPNILKWLFSIGLIPKQRNLISLCLSIGSPKCLPILFLHGEKPNHKGLNGLEKNVLLQAVIKALKSILFFPKPINAIVCEFLESEVFL